MNCKTFDRFYKSDTSCCVITKYLLQKLPDVYIKCTFVFYYLNVTDSLLCLSHKSEKIRVQYSLMLAMGVRLICCLSHLMRSDRAAVPVRE